MARSILDLKHLIEDKPAPEPYKPRGRRQEYVILRDENGASEVEIPSIQGANKMMDKMDELNANPPEGVRFWAVSKISGKIYAGGGATFPLWQTFLDERGM